jgi:hypothetical protein
VSPPFLGRSSLSHTFTHPPTRLQLLTAARHGGSDAIADEELFEEGELEAVFRNEEEVGVLVRLVDWDEVEEEEAVEESSQDVAQSICEARTKRYSRGLDPSTRDHKNHGMPSKDSWTRPQTLTTSSLGAEGLTRSLRPAAQEMRTTRVVVTIGSLTCDTYAGHRSQVTHRDDSNAPIPHPGFGCSAWRGRRGGRMEADVSRTAEWDLVCSIARTTITCDYSSPKVYGHLSH